MKLLLFAVIFTALFSCQEKSSETTSDTVTVARDSASGVIITDTTGLNSMSADTTGMGQAR